MLSEITGETCREYAKIRGSDGGARRDLEDLRAAINHHAAEGFHRGVVNVILPAKGAPRDRWLTRDEAAKTALDVLAESRGTNPPSRQGQGAASSYRQASTATSRSLHSDWTLHRHQSGGHCVGISRGSAGPLFHRLGPGHLLPAGARNAGHRQKAASGSAAPSPARPPSSLARQGNRQTAFRRVQRRASEVGQDGLSKGRRIVRTWWQGQPTHAASHRSNLAHADRR